MMKRMKSLARMEKERTILFSLPLVLALLTLMVWPLWVEALTLDLDTLVPLMKSSDYVVHGVVEEIREEGVLDRGDQSVILSTLRVLGVLKGKKVSERLNVRFLGKICEGDLAIASQHKAVLSSAEEVVLFLTRRDGGETTVTSGIQGKFIVSVGDNGEKVVTSPLGFIPISNQDPEDWPAEMPLTDFLELLRKISAYPQ